MILKSLYLENYRIYKGPVEIKFAMGDKNVTIIKGTNEVGKTTIMNAITWCLYDAELFKDEGKQLLLNENTAMSMGKFEEVPVIVTMTMVNNNGENIIIKRTKNFIKRDDGKFKSDNSKLRIIVEDDGNDSISRYPESFIATHLPKNIREYFLFDGEQLETYFSTSSGNKVKNSVFNLSQLNLIKKAKRHLNSVIGDFSNELDQIKPKLAKLYKEQNKLNENLERYGDDLHELNDNLAKLNSEYEQVENQLLGLGDDPVKWVEKRKRLEEQLDAKEIQIDRYKKDYSNFLINSFNRVFAVSLLNNVFDLCKDLEENDCLPSGYKKNFLEVLLKKNVCICGNNLSENPEAYAKVKKLCDETNQITDIEDLVNQFLGQIRSIKDVDVAKISSNLLNFNFNLDQYKTEKDEIDRQLVDINREFDGGGETEDIDSKISKLNSDLNNLKKIISNKNVEKGSLIKDIEIVREKLKIIERKIKNEEKNSGIVNDIEKSINFCNIAYSEIDNLYLELQRDIHDKLQSLTSEEFKKIHWKDVYEDISIDDEYNILIYENTGRVKSPNDLSKGGKLTLALSFMTALNSLSGFSLPILIDTPMGRLDEPIKENIGKFLQPYLKDKQVTYLVTGSEYSEEFKEGINEFIGKEYVLNYHKEKGEFTKVKVIK